MCVCFSVSSTKRFFQTKKMLNIGTGPFGYARHPAVFRVETKKQPLGRFMLAKYRSVASLLKSDLLMHINVVVTCWSEESPWDTNQETKVMISH